MTTAIRIAVASQNRKSVTGHAGKCRKFWIYAIEVGAATDKTLLELPREQSFHDYRGAGPHPLQGVRTLIAGGMGEGLARRLAGTLPLGQPKAHGEHNHSPGHDHA